MTPPLLLTIAGSDSGGGAGIQADLKTFAAHGAHGMSVVTGVTAQNTLGVRAVSLVGGDLVAAQLEAIFEDLPPAAIKTGMLGSAELVDVVASALDARRGIPLVVDPVMIAASGDPLLEPDAVARVRDRLAPLATLLTPNLPEAEALAGRKAPDLEARRGLAEALGATGRAVLLKGGHAEGAEIVDLLWDGEALHEIRHPRLETPAGHGTGCTLSSAIAARLGRGEELVPACRAAVDWLIGALEHAPRIGSGTSPLDPFWRLRREGTFA